MRKFSVEFAKYPLTLIAPGNDVIQSPRILYPPAPCHAARMYQADLRIANITPNPSHLSREALGYEKKLQRRFAPTTPSRLVPESPAGFVRNRWPTSAEYAI
jgi:hypothetical protein